MGAARSLTDRTAAAIDTRFAHFGFHWGIGPWPGSVGQSRSSDSIMALIAIT
jgi:hypothetical protein